MLKTLIKTYHKVNNVSRLKVIEKIMGEENFFQEEITCFDDGRVSARVKKLQADYTSVGTEIKFLQETAADDAATADKLRYLHGRQYEILRSFAFEASQNLKNIDNCLSAVQDANDTLVIALQGLKAYNDNDKLTAMEKMTEYLQQEKTFGSHYLLNKFYGLMLYDCEMFSEAKPFLQQVTRICPEDVEVHEKMWFIYRRISDERGAETERAIIELLGGQTDGCD